MDALVLRAMWLPCSQHLCVPRGQPFLLGRAEAPREYLGFQLLGRGLARTFVLPGLRAQRDTHDSATDALLCHPQGADGVAGVAGPPGVQGLPVSSSLGCPALSLCLGVPEPRCMPALPRGLPTSVAHSHPVFSKGLARKPQKAPLSIGVQCLASKIQVWMNDVAICDSRIPLTTSSPRPRPVWFFPDRERGVERLELTHAEATACIRRHIRQEDRPPVSQPFQRRERSKKGVTLQAGW